MEMTWNGLLLSCVSLLWISEMVLAFVTTDPNAVVMIGECTCQTVEILPGQFPNLLYDQQPQYRLPDNFNTTFYVFTRNQNSFLQMKTFSLTENLEGTTFDPTKPTLILTHGAQDSALDPIYLYVMYEYLKTVDGNVILQDWSQQSSDTLGVQFLANVVGVGCQMAVLVTNLLNRPGSDIKKFHLSGASLGGQVAGQCGKKLIAMLGQKCARITGLDHAGLWYINQTDPNQYLHSGDADFVDGMHTADFVKSQTLGYIPGYYKPVCDVDFYPDGARVQSACPAPPPFVNDVSISCSHASAVIYFGNSFLNFCNYNSCYCPSVADPSSTPADWKMCLNNCNPATGSVMGYYSINRAGRGPQYLAISKTNPACTTVFSLLPVNSALTGVFNVIVAILTFLKLYTPIGDTLNFIIQGLIGGIVGPLLPLEQPTGLPLIG